jgi:hypothetical protein
MKHLKNFTSLFEFDNTDEITNDIFDLWKRIETDSSGFRYIDGITQEDWIEGITDGHAESEYESQENSVYVDSNGIEWHAEFTLRTNIGWITELDVTIPDEILEKINKSFLECLKDAGLKFKTETRGWKDYILVHDDPKDFIEMIPNIDKPDNYLHHFRIGLSEVGLNRFTGINLYQIDDNNYLISRKAGGMYSKHKYIK